MKTALITLSPEGARIAERLAAVLPEAALYVHEGLAAALPGRRFRSIMTLTAEIFALCRELVYIAPCGVVVRALSGLPQNKRTDPAVVVIDAGGRYSISLLGGHEGGANDLAVRIGNILGAEPVITTTTEALKTVIAGIGCRRGTAAETLIEALREALDRAGVAMDQVRLLATADIKGEEAGLIEASRRLGIPLRFIPGDEIRSTARPFGRSGFVEEKVNLPAVAEPAALLAGRRTQLILSKTVFRGVTVALAREGSIS